MWRPTVVDHAQPQLFSADENRSAQVNFSVPPTAMPKNKRMDAFSRDAFKFGALSGFRHFRTDLRGRGIPENPSVDEFLDLVQETAKRPF